RLARRIEHEHRLGDGVGAPAGEVRERGVRAEREVGVVRPLLEVARRDDEAPAHELRAEGVAALGGVGGGFARGRDLVVSICPAGPDRVEEALGERLTAVRIAVGRRGFAGVAHDTRVAIAADQPAGSSWTTSGRWSLPSAFSMTADPLRVQLLVART